MEQVLSYFRDYENWIYLGLGVLALWQVRKFILAWNEMRGSLFGMERDIYQARLNRAAAMLVVVVIMAAAEFTAVTIVLPSIPGGLPLPTTTLDLLATPTTTLPAMTLSPGETAPDETPTPAEQPAGEVCLVGQLNLTSPANGDRVSGVVTLRGTADITNFGFYTYEIARPGESIWLPIQVGQTPVRNDILGIWDTGTLEPGDYMLRLRITDNVGTEVATCVIQVLIDITP